MSLKILAIDTTSNCLDWLMRCQEYGHQVLWFDRNRRDGSHRQAGEGLVDKLRDLDALRRKWIGWADLIFLPDNTCYLDLLEPFRRIGYPIFGPSVEAAQLELDRGVGQKAMDDAGIETIPGKIFHDYDSAIAYVKREGRAFVSKPSGDAAKALSYVAHDAADLVYMLGRWKKNEKYRADAREHGFILQEKIEGCEMAVGGWYGPGGFSRWRCQNFEHKKLMDGDLGPNTGEMGTVVRYVDSCKLARQVLEPIGPRLAELGYVGYVDNNCIIDAKGKPWPLEWTMRPGWPIFHNQVALHQGDPAKWMLDLLNGYDTLKVSEDVCVSVVVAIPDFPYSKLTNKEVSGIPVYYADDRKHVHLSEVRMADAVPTLIDGKVMDMPGLVTSGDYVCVVTGTGETISGARRSAYAAVRKLRIPNSPFYRLDIGNGRLARQLATIQGQGYARGLTL